MKAYIRVLIGLLSVLVVVQGLEVWKFPKDYLYDETYTEDFDWFNQGTTVVRNGVVNADWTERGKAHESEQNGVTYFLFTPDVEKAEKFGPLEYGVVGAKASEDLSKGAGDEQVQMLVLGDAYAGNFEIDDPILQARVVYACNAPFENKQIYMRLSLVDGSDNFRNITFYWTKSCGSGPRPGFKVDVVEFPNEVYDDEVVEFDDEDDGPNSFDYTAVENGITRTAWSYSEPAHKFVTVWAPDFMLSIAEGHGSLVYGSPTVKVADPTILRVDLIDSHDVTHNVLSEFSGYVAMKVVQTCLQASGETKVSMEINMGSYDPVRFSWIKSCDGGKSTGFSVQTEKDAQKANIIEKGVVVPEWNTTAIKVPASQSSSSFYIKTTGPKTTFEKIYAIVKPRDMLAAIVTPRKLSVTSSAAEIKVEYRCLTKGTARVTMVIIQGSAQEPTKFSWLKECPKRIRTPAQQGYMTANRAMFLFCFVITVVGLLGGYTWVQYKRRVQAEKKARLQATVPYESI